MAVTKFAALLALGLLLVTAAGCSRSAPQAGTQPTDSAAGQSPSGQQPADPTSQVDTQLQDPNTDVQIGEVV